MAVTWTRDRAVLLSDDARSRERAPAPDRAVGFALDGRTVYLSGGRERSHWVKNLRCTPDVTVALGGRASPAARASSKTRTRTRARAPPSTTSTRRAMAAICPAGVGPPLPVAVDLGEDPTPSR